MIEDELKGEKRRDGIGKRRGREERRAWNELRGEETEREKGEKGGKRER